MEISKVNATKSTAICGAEKPCARMRDHGSFEIVALSSGACASGFYTSVVDHT